MSSSPLSALKTVAAELEQVARSQGGERMAERDFQHALESATGARSATVRLAHWPEGGPVDLVLEEGVALELRWCRSGDTLGNCVWDIAKLGCAIAEEKIAKGFVVAGAPEAHWDSRASGVDLFASRAYYDDELARCYEGWWRFWCKDVATRPVDLPRSVAVVDAGRVPVELNGVTFFLRLARVEVVDAAWRPYICPHRWRDERCPPRRWDPDGWGGLQP